MEWLQENIGQLATLLGLFYAVARIVVALTPTPKDDKAMKEVSVFLRALAAAFGLDLKQGIEKKPPGSGTAGKSLTLIVCLSMLPIMSMPGCITSDVRANLVASNKVFAGTIRMLTIAVKADEFDDQEIEQISVLVHQGEKILADWEAAVLRGDDPVPYAELFSNVLDRLLLYEAQSRE